MEGQDTGRLREGRRQLKPEGSQEAGMRVCSRAHGRASSLTLFPVIKSCPFWGLSLGAKGFPGEHFLSLQ